MFWLLVVGCFVAPLLMLGWQIVGHASAAVELWQDGFRLRLLGRTLLYNFAVAAIACLLALPAAIVIGRGRGGAARWIIVLMPISLLMPSITFEYGWKQALTLADIFPSPQSFGDVVRCIWTLACWLWPIPAAAGAIALRRADPAVLEQAALDGVLGRVTLRLLAKPLAAGMAIAFVLASQEFAVFEPSGISVIATEVRMVYETGAFSSPTNPITQVGLGGGAMGSSQPARIAAAVVTSLPMLVCTILAAGVALLFGRKLAAETDVAVADRPAAVRPRISWTIAAVAVVVASVVVPIVALIVSLSHRLEPLRVWRQFDTQITGSLILAGSTAIISFGLLDSLSRRPRAVMLLGAVCFLVGGQILAVSFIRVYNHTATSWLYDSAAVSVMAYLSRFGWIMLAAAAATWTRPWRQLRDLAATDGASASQTARRVILPVAWPSLAAAAALIAVLTLTEVPATMLLQPLRPQPIVPMLMTWVHMQRYDSMIEGTLLLSGVVMIGAIIIIAMWAAAVRIGWWKRNAR